MAFLRRLCFHTGPEPAAPWWHSTAFSLLRECLLLLHWLLLHHSSFSQSCRPLLHLYDQVIPAVQDILRRIPERSESEGKCIQIYNKSFLILHRKCLLLPYCLLMSSLPEVALEEICRSDGDEADDLDIDTISWLTLAMAREMFNRSPLVSSCEEVRNQLWAALIDMRIKNSAMFHVVCFAFASLCAWNKINKWNGLFKMSLYRYLCTVPCAQK